MVYTWAICSGMTTQSYRDMAQRLVNAENRFVECVIEVAGFTQEHWQPLPEAL